MSEHACRSPRNRDWSSFVRLSPNWTPGSVAGITTRWLIVPTPTGTTPMSRWTRVPSWLPARIGSSRGTSGRFSCIRGWICSRTGRWAALTGHRYDRAELIAADFRIAAQRRAGPHRRGSK
jgi:hypothetical protein